MFKYANGYDWQSHVAANAAAAMRHMVQPFAVPIVIQAPPRGPDPYENHRKLEEAVGRERVAAMTAEHPDNVRARKIAALRESLSAKVEPRYPHEGRSDRVYRVNER